MKQILILSILSASLVGCVTANKSFIRNGKQVYVVKCNGLARSIADCHAKAAQTCGGNYSEMGADSTNSFIPNMGGKGYLPITNRSLMFTCE